MKSGFFYWDSLVLTYFRERKLTIIGAVLFHGPVRDGKGWGQDAMGTRLKRVVAWRYPGHMIGRSNGVMIGVSGTLWCNSRL